MAGGTGGVATGCGGLLLDGGGGEVLADALEHVGGMDGFQEGGEVVAFLARGEDVVIAIVAGEEQDLAVGYGVDDGDGELNAVDVAEADIAEEELWTEIEGHLEGGFAVIGDACGEAGAREQGGDAVGDEFFIVHDEDEGLAILVRVPKIFPWNVTEGDNLVVQLGLHGKHLCMQSRRLELPWVNSFSSCFAEFVYAEPGLRGQTSSCLAASHLGAFSVWTGCGLDQINMASRYDHDKEKPMDATEESLPDGMRFKSILQADVPKGRDGKHKVIITQLLSDIEKLADGSALKIPLSELPDSKENIRSALSRAANQKKLSIATSSNEHHLFVWKTTPAR